MVVTPTPNSSDTNTVRVASTVSLSGSSKLSALKAALRPPVSPRPTAIPITDATRPVTTASTTTEPST